MTGFNHGLTGAVIALTVKQPALALPLAFISHFATDALPHWDYGTGRKDGKIGSRKFHILLFTDFGLSILLMVVLALLFPAHKWLIWGCMILAASPDLAWFYYRYLKSSVRKTQYDIISRFHIWTEWSETPKGIYVEIAWLVVIGSIILSLRWKSRP